MTDKPQATATQKISLVISILSLIVVSLFFVFGADFTAKETVKDVALNTTTIKELDQTVGKHEGTLKLHQAHLEVLDDKIEGVPKDLKELTSSVNELSLKQTEMSSDIKYIVKAIEKIENKGE